MEAAGDPPPLPDDLSHWAALLGARPLADDLSRWVAFSHRRLPCVLQSAARQEASQQRRLDKKKAEREKRDQLEPEALVRTHQPLLTCSRSGQCTAELGVWWCRQRKAEEKERKKQLRKRGPQAKCVLPLSLFSPAFNI